MKNLRKSGTVGGSGENRRVGDEKGKRGKERNQAGPAVINVLPGRPPGYGSVVHLWFQDQRQYRRLCDGFEWTTASSVLGNEPTPFLESCPDCVHTLKLDRLRACARLNLMSDALLYCGDISPVVPGSLAVRGELALESRQSVLIDIPMTTMAHFYAARNDSERQREIATQYRDRRMLKSGPPFYQPVVNLVQAEHWASGDLDRLIAAIPGFLADERNKDAETLRRARRADKYEKVLLDYTQFAVRRNIVVYDVLPPIAMEVIQGVIITARSARRMTVDGMDNLALMWWRDEGPSPDYQYAISYFLNFALSQTLMAWSDCIPAIWDVQRQFVTPGLNIRPVGATRLGSGVALLGHAGRLTRFCFFVVMRKRPCNGCRQSGGDVRLRDVAVV